MEYIIQLSKKLNKMLEENEKAKIRLSKMNIPSYCDDAEVYRLEVSKLSEKDREIYYKDGMLYSKAEIKRVRLELNKELIRQGY